MGNHIVFVISKRTCPFCHTAKNILNKYDILPEQFKVLEIDGDKDCADIQDYMLQLTGGRTVPRVFKVNVLEVGMKPLQRTNLGNLSRNLERLEQLFKSAFLKSEQKKILLVLMCSLFFWN